MKIDDVVSRFDIAIEGLEFIEKVKTMKVYKKGNIRYILEMLRNDRLKVFMIYEEKK